MSTVPSSPDSNGVQAPAPLGVLLVDDQSAVREGLARLIACLPLQLRCIGTAANSAQALHAAIQLRPDVVVLDVDLAGEDGLALLPQLSAQAGVLVLTSHGDPATRQRALHLGARAFIEKHQPAAELLSAIVRIGQSRGEKAPGSPGSTSPGSMAASSAAQTRRPS